MAFQTSLNFGNKLLTECSRQAHWSQPRTISRWTRMTEQKPKTTGSGFLTVNCGNSLIMDLLPPDESPSTCSTNHGSGTHSQMVTGIFTPLSVLVMVQPPNGNTTTHPSHTSLPCHVLQLPCRAPEPWEGESGRRSMAPATHGPPAKAGCAWKSCHGCNLISGIIVPSLHLQITSLSPTSIFSWETLNRKFRKILNAEKAPCSYFYI